MMRRWLLLLLTLPILTAAAPGPGYGPGGGTPVHDHSAADQGGLLSDLPQRIRITDAGSNPTTNDGLELLYDDAANTATLQAYDRDGAVWDALELKGLTVALYNNGTQQLVTNSGGITFAGNLGVAADKYVGLSTNAYFMARDSADSNLLKLSSTTSTGVFLDSNASSSGQSFTVYHDGAGSGTASALLQLVEDGTFTLKNGSGTDVLTITSGGVTDIAANGATLDIGGFEAPAKYLAAEISSTGGLGFNHLNVSASSKVATGQYDVTQSAGLWSAMSADAICTCTINDATAGICQVSPGGGSTTDDVRVTTFDTSGVLTDHHFHLICVGR